VPEVTGPCLSSGSRKATNGYPPVASRVGVFRAQRAPGGQSSAGPRGRAAFGHAVLTAARGLAWINENRRCSIRFHFEVPGGRWQTAISRPVSSASFCSSTFHSRVRLPLEPPKSAVLPPPTGGGGDGPGVGDGVGVGVGVGACVGTVIVSLINVTAPLRASARPFSVTPEPIEIDVRARMLPAKVEDVPSVAELPICQNTLLGLAPLISATTLPAAASALRPRIAPAAEDEDGAVGGVFAS